MPRDQAYLLDILNSARKAMEYLGNKSYAEFESNQECLDAIIRRIEIIGEASSRVSADTKKRLPDLPWAEMKGMRNLLIHEYDAIDTEEVWRTVKNDLPPLILMLEEVIVNP